MSRLPGLVALALLAFAPDLLAQEAPPTPVPSIITSGDATVRRVPDEAFVMIAVETRARTPRDAQQQNADAMTSVQQQLGKAGIPRDAVRTTGYSIEQEFDFANGKRTPRGYVARNGVEVRVEPVERVGVVLDAVVDAGATTVSGVRFDLKDRVAAEREALRLAVVDARARADAMAAGVGKNVDRVVRISDTPLPVMRPQPIMMSRALAAPAQETTPIEAGTIEIRAQVELTVTIR